MCDRFAIAMCIAGALCAALALPGCRSEPPSEPEPPARRPPEQACEQARTKLADAGPGGRILFEETGEAMVDRQSWMRMSSRRRDDVIETLAVVAGCSAETPQREVEVTIRSEDGTVLVTRSVRPSTDFRAD